MLWAICLPLLSLWHRLLHIEFRAKVMGGIAQDLMIHSPSPLLPPLVHRRRRTDPPPTPPYCHIFLCRRSAPAPLPTWASCRA